MFIKELSFLLLADYEYDAGRCCGHRILAITAIVRGVVALPNDPANAASVYFIGETYFVEEK